MRAHARDAGVCSDALSRALPLPQVEFYFSDSNLPQDKFLKEKVAENAEGCECCRRPCSRPLEQAWSWGRYRMLCVCMCLGMHGGFMHVAVARL